MSDILLGHAYFLKYDIIERRVMKPYPPLGILYLSAFLKREGFSVDVFDATFRDFGDFEATVKRVRPQIVGLYANIITRDNVLRLAQIAKANGVEFVLAGGPDASEWCDHYFANGVDIIGISEGELTLQELIPWLQQKGMKDIEHVRGIVFLKDGRVHRTPPRQAITNLDSLPWPDRDALNMEEYFRAWKSHHGESSVSLITARGCPFHCAWCSSEVFGHTHRQRSPKDVVDEMLMLKQRYKPDIMWISDDVLTINKKWTHEFVREVKTRNAQHPYECLSRVDLVDYDILKGLRDTGCFRIWYGAESGSQKILDSMRKGTTVAQVREAARITQEVGMQAGFFILLGYPDETTADIRMTIDFLKETRPDVVGTSVAFPIKGTEFYQRVEKRVMPNENWSSRNQNKLLFKGKYPRLYYWFAVRWLVKEVNVNKMWRMKKRPYSRILTESVKAGVARLGVAAVGATSFYRSQA
ncbi:MAG: B12-binding domain-containing radical SAM protein [Acidobacteria bacterium]|nr:MAG: B12-binding domain-containing radical SAM protein [Acidobacteriota bacterium]